MKSMTEEEKIQKNKKLCKKYPFLLPRNSFSDKIPEDYDYSYTEWDAMEDGWRTAFGDLMLEEMGECLKKTGNLKTFRIDQLKEKFGQLRLYHHGGNDKIGRIIDKYSVLSENICIKCGKPDVYMTNRGWMFPCCKECWEADKHHTNIPYESFVEGSSRMEDKMRWRSMAPGEDDWTDYEVDISKTAEKIREGWRKAHEQKGNS